MAPLSVGGISKSFSNPKARSFTAFRDAEDLQEFLEAFTIVTLRDSEDSPLLKVFSISQSGDGPSPVRLTPLWSPRLPELTW